MKVGNQSVANDLVDLEGMISGIQTDHKALKKVAVPYGVKVSDFNERQGLSRLFIGVDPGALNVPPLKNGAGKNGDWYHSDMMGENYAVQEVTHFYSDQRFYRRRAWDGFKPWVKYLTSANTITDANGFIKEA